MHMHIDMHMLAKEEMAMTYAVCCSSSSIPKQTNEESWGPGSRHAAVAWLHSQKIDRGMAAGGSRPTHSLIIHASTNGRRQQQSFNEAAPAITIIFFN